MQTKLYVFGQRVGPKKPTRTSAKSNKAIRGLKKPKIRGIVMGSKEPKSGNVIRGPKRTLNGFFWGRKNQIEGGCSGFAVCRRREALAMLIERV